MESTQETPHLAPLEPAAQCADSLTEVSLSGESRRRMTRLAAAMTGFGLTAVAAWTMLSGLSEPPEQVFTRNSQVQLSLPYRGVCQSLRVSSDDQEIALTVADIRAGLARVSFPLPAGRHDLVLTFDSVIPGMQRTYPLTVIVDSTPPSLTLAKLPLLSAPQSATIEESMRLEGKVEPLARLLVGDQEVPLAGDGSFSTEWPLQEGWNHLLLRAEDQAGNLTARKLSIFRDVKDPDITWRTPPGFAFDKNKARLELSVEDDGPLAGLKGVVDGKPIVWHRKSTDDWIGTTPALPEGRHEVQLTVADKAGRVVTSQREILIDSSETLGEAVLGLGARGEDVVLLHQRLAEAGYMAAGGGSVFTAATEAALRALQSDEGLEVSGRADTPTLMILGPRIVVNLSRFDLVLERPGQPDRRWSIACGAPEFPTPTGRFVIYEKIADPTWLPPNSEWAKEAKPVDPGPDNPLGTRWIGLDWGGVGIHGTNAPWTVGSAASHGCMRMETSQVEELFSLVEVGTPVIILGGWEADPLLKKFWP